MLSNQAFHDQDDIYSVLDRHLRLWRDYGPAVASMLGDRSPSELFIAATGIQVEEFLALGLALFAHFLAWKPGQPMRLLDDFNSDIPVRTKEAFLKMTAASIDELSVSCQAPPRSKWDFLALQSHPALRIGGSLLVLDGPYLFERITSGLYWMVHDHLKATESELARQQWSQAWGEMVEKMAMDDLLPHAPTDLSGEKTFFDEDDVEAAYPIGGNADGVIDLGEGIGVFEIVSHRLTVPTRINGDRLAFDGDMEKVAFKKFAS